MESWEFPEGRWLSIHVRDIDLKWHTTAEMKADRAASRRMPTSVLAPTRDLLMIAAS